uniref:IFT81 calponin homology domain-containing protein n=1 Tax=Parascaris equorum TaxID=6256 RepID=A0A914R788_PAREQ
MTAESLRTIVNGLNNEPFNMNLNLISFDSISSIQWRRGIVEGEKTAINPILEWIFKDTESLKELEVPGNFFHYSIIQITEIHSQVIERRKDTLLAEDIRSDLKAMQQEKDQLNRRIEKIKHKLRLVGNLENYLQLAAKCREENEKNVKIALHRQEQRNAVSKFFIS